MNPNLQKFGVAVVSDISGVPESEIGPCCGSIADDLTPQQLDWADLFDRVLEAVMSLMENCNNPERFSRFVQRQPRLGRAWFRTRFAEKAHRGCESCDGREFADAICRRAGQLDQVTITAIYQDHHKPDFSIFGQDDGDVAM